MSLRVWTDAYDDNADTSELQIKMKPNDCCTANTGIRYLNSGGLRYKENRVTRAKVLKEPLGVTKSLFNLFPGSLILPETLGTRLDPDLWSCLKMFLTPKGYQF